MNQCVVQLVIPEPVTTRAVRRIRNVLAAHGGAWVVIFVEDGWRMARADSVIGVRILRSGAPTIAGVFDCRARIGHLRDALKAARLGERIGVPRRTYPSWERRKGGEYKRAWRQRRRELGLKVS